MITIDKKNIESIISNSLTELNKSSKDILDKLKKFKKNNTPLDYNSSIYINKVINEFEKNNFIALSLHDLERIVTDIGEIPKCKRIFNRQGKETFLKDEILKILDYKGKRSNLYPGYFQEVGIKSCVYCNSQLTINVEKEKIDKGKKRVEYIAKYQLDHYYPKDKYPHLSIALFNLYPVCASCNLIKSNNTDVDFKLYSDDIKPSDFIFELDKSSKAKYLATRNIEDLKITFKHKSDSSYKDIFRINDIYKTQYDIAEEIILKSLTYNSAFRKILIKKFGDHRINNNLINRLILGNYTEEEEIHKRPVSKFMQDIGKEVGLI